MKISAVIISYNEERNIARCIESMRGIADEVIVVDSFSTDATIEIAGTLGARVIPHAFEGHIQQKNFAIDQANFEWILSLDSDEALSDELKRMIFALKEKRSFEGYTMKRLTNYCGHWVRHCGWYPDTKLRLASKEKVRWSGVNPHDILVMKNDEKTGYLDADILHYSYYSREDHLRQIEYFSAIAANELMAQGKNSNWLIIALKCVAQFIKSYFIKRGFLDGSAGWNISTLSAYATYRKYFKLKQLISGDR